MARPPRISFPGAHYHLLNRFVDRHPFFQTEPDYRRFLDTYYELAPLHGIRTYAYCLMPNHFHVVLETERGDLSRFLQQFLFRVAREMNRHSGRVGHLFQDRAKTLLIEDGAYFETVVGYVLLNPVRAGLCRDVFGYRWSSAGTMVSDGPWPVERHLLAERVSGRDFGPADVEGQRDALIRWARRLEATANADRFAEGVRGTFGGSAGFRKKVLLQNERRERFEDSRRRRCTDRDFDKVTWEELGEMAERIRGHLPFPLRRAWKNEATFQHDLRTFLASKVAHWSYERIRAAEADRFSLPSYAMAMHRMRRDPRKREVARLVRGRAVSGSNLVTDGGK